VYRLILLIDKAAYDVTPVEPGLDVRRAWRLRKVPLTAKDRPAVYDVVQKPHGLECDCLGFLRWNGERGTVCKHIDALLSLGQFPGVREK
jgi:hypothetical protein